MRMRFDMRITRTKNVHSEKEAEIVAERLVSGIEELGWKVDWVNWKDDISLFDDKEE